MRSSNNPMGENQRPRPKVPPEPHGQRLDQYGGFLDVKGQRTSVFHTECRKSETGRKELTRLACAYYRTTPNTIRRYDLSFQDFRDPVAHLDAWHRKTGKPVLLADAAGLRHPAPPGGFVPNDGEWYADVLAALFDNPDRIGFHFVWCRPAHNKARRRGLLYELERPDQENVELIRAANAKVSHGLNERY